MAGDRIKLEVLKREDLGSRASRRLRGLGQIPGVLYGAGKPAHAFVVPERRLRDVLTGDHGVHAILDVVFDGQKTAHHAVLKDYQVDPRHGKLLHVDLHEIRLDQTIQAQVSIELVGTPEGVVQGGVLSQIAREVLVEALATEVPDALPLPVSELLIGDSLRVGDLVAPKGVKILDDEESVLVTVTPPTRVIEPEVEEEEEEELEEGEVPEGEEVPEEGAEPVAEEGAEPGEKEPSE